MTIDAEHERERHTETDGHDEDQNVSFAVRDSAEDAQQHAQGCAGLKEAFVDEAPLLTAGRQHRGPDDRRGDEDGETADADEQSQQARNAVHMAKIITEAAHA